MVYPKHWMRLQLWSSEDHFGCSYPIISYFLSHNFYITLLLILWKIFLYRYDHPRFGKIKCIRTIKPVKAGEELTVEYGYDHNGLGINNPDAPQWYKSQYQKFLVQLNGR